MPAGHHPQPRGKELAWVSLAALGVVYGDIGTSPLYAMRECLSGEHSIAPSRDHVFGVVSLFFWALLLVVVIKYLVFVLRADNKGEGGILALAALVQQEDKTPRRKKLSVPILLALFGAGLLYGDGVITPAVSVLGAVEGLDEITQTPITPAAPKVGIPEARPPVVGAPCVATDAKPCEKKGLTIGDLVVPISAVILIGLFVVQRIGTARIGSIFGWIMLVWFVAIGAVGVPYILNNPEILKAASPTYAVAFMLDGGWRAFLLLGSVVLCITGGEALYADMGHFGRRPIRLAWSFIVFPGLLLNYFGQGALYLQEGAKVNNPFYDLVSGGPLLIPMIILATMAAIIASQALISGAFSLTNQAVQLGYLPRVSVVHTSHKHEGQIYIPEVNYILMVACLVLVLSFKSSAALAAAYGIAVTGTMGITSYLYFLVCRRNWKYSLGSALALFIPFVSIDLAFFSANSVKIAAGGWFPLAVGVGVFVIMTTWWRGRFQLSEVMAEGQLSDELFLSDIDASGTPRVAGTAVFMASSTDGIPNVLLHHLKHNKVLHKQVVLLSIVTENVPFVVSSGALNVRDLGHGFFRIIARAGFMQQPNVPRIIARCSKQGLVTNSSDTTYYLGRQTLLTTGKSPMAKWRKVLFGFLARNSRPPTAFFHLPPNRVVELGLQIEL